MTAPTPVPAVSGDREAFGRLYARHAGQVFGVVLARVRDRHLAEDLTAETFARALRATGSTPVAAVRDDRAWLDTIALNLVRGHYRRSGVQREVSTGEVPDVGSREVGPEQAVIDRETNEELHRALEQLAPRQRECVRLRFWQELPVAQTATAMGCSVGTVKAQQHRAVRHLARILSDPEPRSRGTEKQVASTRDAVTTARQVVTGAHHQATEHDRAQQLTRWHSDDQAVEQPAQERDALTAQGGAA